MIFQYSYVQFSSVFLGNNSYVYMDKAPPVIINCPLDINKSAELGVTRVPVFWMTPSAIDERGTVINVDATHKSGENFTVGSTTKVSYVFMDDSCNSARCNFSVTVTGGMHCCVCT